MNRGASQGTIERCTYPHKYKKVSAHNINLVMTKDYGGDAVSHIRVPGIFILGNVCTTSDMGFEMAYSQVLSCRIVC